MCVCVCVCVCVCARACVKKMTLLVLDSHALKTLDETSSIRSLSSPTGSFVASRVFATSFITRALEKKTSESLSSSRTNEREEKKKKKKKIWSKIGFFAPRPRPKGGRTAPPRKGQAKRRRSRGSLSLSLLDFLSLARALFFFFQQSAKIKEKKNASQSVVRCRCCRRRQRRYRGAILTLFPLLLRWHCFQIIVEKEERRAR